MFITLQRSNMSTVATIAGKYSCLYFIPPTWADKKGGKKKPTSNEVRWKFKI